jgi:hypothetical protein
MEESCSTGQSPQWAVVPVEEEEEGEGAEEEGGEEEEEEEEEEEGKEEKEYKFVTFFLVPKFTQII